MRILHTMLRVGDLERSLRFYTEVLQMRLLRRKDYPDGKFTLAFVGYGVGGFDLNQLVDENHLFFNEFPPGQGKQQWVGAFSSSAPETVVAYALAGDAPTACPLGTVRSSPSPASTMLNTR